MWRGRLVQTRMVFCQYGMRFFQFLRSRQRMLLSFAVHDIVDVGIEFKIGGECNRIHFTTFTRPTLAWRTL